MKSKLVELNDGLYQEFKRLGNTDLKGEMLIEEMSRSRALCDVAEKIIGCGRLALDATRLMDMSPDIKSIPMLLE